MRIFPARITRIWQATPTIKAFELKVDDPGYKYLPGQWVELSVVIDGDIKTGGYSLTTSPNHGGLVGLAVKSSSRHPVTRWLHEAKEGDTVDITRGQGAFVFLPDMAEDIVLIGGGVGVTPLLSIFRYVRDHSPETRATLLYSVCEVDEILFREELEQAVREHPNLKLEITVTQPNPAWHGQIGRIDKQKLISLNASPNALFFLCGPKGMVEDMSTMLGELGVPASRIIFEKWW